MTEKEPRRELPSKLLEDAERGRQEEYTNKLFVMHSRPMADWSEEVLRRVRGESQPIPEGVLEEDSLDNLPAPASSASTPATGEAASTGEPGA